jgi:hypothetical protein
LGGQIKENEMSGECGIWGGGLIFVLTYTSALLKVQFYTCIFRK